MVKIIWSYWDRDQPLSVQYAIHTWKKYNSDYIICILTEKNISNYLDLSSFPKKFNNISSQKKADVIRLAILEKYGGVWLDANIYLSKSLSSVWDNDYDVGGFYADYFTTNMEYPVLESWFISSPKNSELIKNWKKEFFIGIDSENYEDYIRNLELTVDLQNVGKTDTATLEGKIYLMIHCSFLKVINDKKYKLKVFPASINNGPFEYLSKNNWNPQQAVFYLLKNTNDQIPDVLKMRGCERYILDESWDKLEDNSIIKKLINKYTFSQNWFRDEDIKKLNIDNNSELHILEIGSYEGKSTIWFIENILLNEKSTITCVDLWLDYVENINSADTYSNIKSDYIKLIKNTFINNINASEQREKVIIKEGYSYEILSTLISQKQQYDIIFIDGNHTAPFVISDIIMSWYLLKSGGIIIFDDYLWTPPYNSDDITTSPRIAIDSFLKIFKHYIEEISIGYQIIIKKIKYL